MNELTKLNKEEVDLLFHYADGRNRKDCPISSKLYQIGLVGVDGSVKVDEEWIRLFKITPSGRARIKREQVLRDIACKPVEKRLAERETVHGKEMQQERERKMKAKEKEIAAADKKRLAYIQKHGHEPAKQLSLI